MNAWLRQFWQRSQVAASRRAADQIVRQIADRSLSAAREQLSANLSRMRPAELIGYVQARSHRVVRDEARKAARDDGLPEERFDRFVLPAKQRAAQQIIRQLQAQPVMPLPAAHVKLRIAG